MFESLSVGITSLALSVLVFLPARSGKAEPIAPATASDRVTSQAFFERGKSLFVEGRFAEACPLLEESHRLAPGIGVLLHLGACFEKLGKTASAWAAFQEAADRARVEGDSVRESMAHERADVLRSRVSHLTVQLHLAGSPDGAPLTHLPEGAQIERDGTLLSIAILGLDQPLDPGQHRIVVRVPGMQDAARDISLSEGEHSSIEVELVPQPRPPSVTATASAELPRRELLAPPMHQYPSHEVSSGGSWFTWTTVGVGVAGLLTGGAAGLVAYTKMQDARSQCEGYPKDQCPPGALRLQEQAKLPANIATAGVAVGVGSLALAGGYWLATRSGRTVVTGTVSPANALISLQTRW